MGILNFVDPSTSKIPKFTYEQLADTHYGVRFLKILGQKTEENIPLHSQSTLEMYVCEGIGNYSGSGIGLIQVCVLVMKIARELFLLSGFYQTYSV